LHNCIPRASRSVGPLTCLADDRITTATEGTSGLSGLQYGCGKARLGCPASPKVLPATPWLLNPSPTKATFFLAQAGAAGVLTGLVLVGVSINLQKIVSDPSPGLPCGGSSGAAGCLGPGRHAAASFRLRRRAGRVAGRALWLVPGTVFTILVALFAAWVLCSSKSTGSNRPGIPTALSTRVRGMRSANFAH
jgi:hypothetical protein